MKLIGQGDYLKLGFVGFVSRVLTLVLGKYCSLCHMPYDKSASMHPTKSPFSFLNSWDSIHFLSIAENGYTYEHALPFFPLLPYISRALNFCDHLTVGIVFSNLSFIISVLVLFKISLIKFSRDTSMIATLLFIFNPASIIFSSFYTESLFTLIFLLGYFYILKNKMLRASILFGLASLCRSNGVLLIIFVKSVYAPVVLLPVILFQCYSLLLMWKSRCSFRIFIPYSYIQRVYWDQGFFKFVSTNNIPNMIIGFPVILYCLYILKEFTASRVYVFKLEKQRKSANSSTQGYFDPTEKHNHGLHNLHKVQPCIIHGPTKSYQKSLKFPAVIVLSDALGYIKHTISSLVSNTTLTKFILDPFFCEYSNPISKLAAILALQTFTLIFFIHWNIAMRFVSFNPFIYWMGALITQAHFYRKRYRAVAGFFFVYGVLYIVMFSCFYPPA